MRCEWCGKEHTTTADVVVVTIVGGVDGIICRKCQEDFDAEVADEAEYQASLASASRAELEEHRREEYAMGIE